MLSGLLEGGAALLIAICGGIYIIGQMRENARKNEQDIKTIREMLETNQESMLNLLEKNMQEVKALIDTQKDHNRENLGREISHIKDLISLTNNETREDIKRLEAAQRESNRIKERLAIAENAIKSLHHRLDIEPPILLKDND